MATVLGVELKAHGLGLWPGLLMILKTFVVLKTSFFGRIQRNNNRLKDGSMTYEPCSSSRHLALKLNQLITVFIVSPKVRFKMFEESKCPFWSVKIMW
jgi:hypothetical protein